MLTTSIEAADGFIGTGLKGSVALVYHGDADGCSSAAILYVLIRRLHPTIVPRLFAPLQGGSRVGIDTARKLVESGFDNVIVVDLGEKEEEVIDFLTAKNRVRLLWIDHHKDEKPLSGDFIYYNPHQLMPELAVPPASAIVYAMASRLLSSSNAASDLSWIAALGIVGDKGEGRAPEIIKAAFNRFPNLAGGPSFGEFVILKQMVSLMSSARSFFGREGSIHVVEALIEAAEKGNPSALLYGENGTKLRYSMYMSSKIVGRILNDGSNFEEHPGLLICEINVMASVQNYLASVLGRKFPDRVICVINHGTNPGSIHVELRRGEKVNADLRVGAQNIAQSFGGSGGGHKAAAGIRISRTLADWPAVKNALIESFSLAEMKKPAL